MLTELVFRRLLALQRQDLLEQAFEGYVDADGTEHPAAIPDPGDWLVTQLARSGLWRHLGHLEEVIADEAFPDWDDDTLFDVIELFHNQVVSVPKRDADGRIKRYDPVAGRAAFRKTVNEVLGRREPKMALQPDGRIVELGPADANADAWELDVFISHASEDKDALARPLAEELRSRGYRVFYDEFSLLPGDNLGEKIDAGLAKARRGIVILSPAFLARHWPRRELDALRTREATSGETVLIPIWHGVDVDDVANFAPSLANRLALTSSAGLDAVVVGVERALQRRDHGAANPVAGAGASAESAPAAANGSQATNDIAPPPKRERGRLGRWLDERNPTVRDLIIVGAIGAVLAGIVLGAPSLLDRRGDGTAVDDAQGGNRAPDEEVADNARAAREERRRRERLRTDRAGKRLNEFAGRRCSSMAKRPPSALATVRCPVNGSSVVMSRLPDDDRARYYFNTESARMPAYSGEAGVCEGWWTYWLRYDERPAGLFSLRGNGSRVRILWTYGGHAVVVSAVGGPNGAPRLCGLWRALLDVPDKT